jgi:ATP-binding cassette, subfamily B, bacterial
MRHKDESAVPAPPSLENAIRYGGRIVWSAGSRYCIAMGIGALLAALLAPASIVILGLVVSEINELISNGGEGTRSLNFWILLVALAAFLGLVFQAAQSYAKGRLRDALSHQMQQRLLRHAATLDASILDDRHCQNVLERANQDPGQKLLDLLDGLIQVTTGGVQVLSLAGVLLWIEPWWTVGLIAAMLPVFVASYFTSRIRHHHQRIRTVQRRWTNYYARALTHREWSQSIRVLGISQLMLDRHDRQMAQLIEDNRRVSMLQIVIRLLTSILLLVVIGGALWFAAQRAARGELNIGLFTAFWMAAWRFRDVAGKIGNAASSIMDSRLAIGLLHEFFALRTRLHDTGTETPKLVGEISLRNVSFRYSDQSQPVLHDVNLDIHPGEIVALVGPNGAGKSTLAKLIARLYAPSSGTILVDGVPIENISAAHFHRHVALMQQVAPRFEATAGENIAFGDWDRLKEDPRGIREIAQVAGVDELLDRLPQGLDTMLGRTFGDYDLSGGQWKKLALARALAGDPRIVILDEPAANLDIETERLVHQQLRQVLQGRTTILISHHFSSVLMADRIVVLVEGRIEEQGTHAELCAAGGVYASMCQLHREMTSEDRAATSKEISKERSAILSG